MLFHDFPICVRDVYNTKYEFIDYSDSLDVSERIDVYNNILAKLKKQ